MRLQQDRAVVDQAVGDVQGGVLVDVVVALHPERRVGQVVGLQRVARPLQQDGRRRAGLAVT